VFFLRRGLINTVWQSLVFPLVFLVLLACTAWTLGRLLDRRVGFADRLEEFTISTSLGLGALGTLLYLLGLIGFLRLPAVIGLFLLIHLASLGTTRKDLGVRDFILEWKRGAVILGLLLPPMILALYPATGFDANTYHLPYAQAFAQDGSVEFLPMLRFPVFPQLNELIFTVPYLIQGFPFGGSASQLSQLLTLMLTSLLLVSWGRRLDNPRVGIWAAALWLGTPLAVWIGVQAYVDVGLALYVTASLYCFQRWLKLSPGNEAWFWLMMAGAMAGFAAGSKYLGLFFVLMIGLLVLASCLRRRKLLPALVFFAVSLTTLLPWYVRIVYHTGNPVFPYYTAVFGDNQWAPPEPEITIEGGYLGIVKDSLGFLAMTPWRSLWQRHVFQKQAPLSPWGVVLPFGLIPLVLFRRRGWAGLLLLLVAYSLFWLTTVRDLRFLLPALPVFHLILADGLSLLHEKWPSPRVTFWVAVALLLPGYGYAGFKLVGRGPLPLSLEQRETYLAQRVEGYRALKFLRKKHGDEFMVYTLNGEWLAGYAWRKSIGDHFGPARFSRINRVLNNSRALFVELQRLGVDHVLILRQPGSCLSEDAFFQSYFKTELLKEKFILLELRESRP